MTEKSESASKSAKLKLNDEDVLLFCAKCFASSDNASWGGEVMDGHCFNCGAGGCTVSLKRWAIAMIRESASWVGKRYYPAEEDVEHYEEIKALRSMVKDHPGRSAEESAAEKGLWTVTQELHRRGASEAVFVRARNGRDALYKARLDLPYVAKPGSKI